MNIDDLSYIDLKKLKNCHVRLPGGRFCFFHYTTNYQTVGLAHYKPTIFEDIHPYDLQKKCRRNFVPRLPGGEDGPTRMALDGYFKAWILTMIVCGKP